MGDLFYSTLATLGRFPAWVASRPRVIGVEHARREGAYILASSHLSPYDIPMLMRHTPRHLDFVSIVELFQRPFSAWFLTHMNAFPLDRRRADPKTVRIILERLERGRVVAMFPEGRLPTESESVLHGGTFRPGVARIARLANVPIVPAVVLNSAAWSRFTSYLPLRRTQYAVAFGPAINVEDEERAEAELAAAYRRLYAQLTSGD